jgi:hypothetical protein
MQLLNDKNKPLVYNDEPIICNEDNPLYYMLDEIETMALDDLDCYFFSFSDHLDSLFFFEHSIIVLWALLSCIEYYWGTKRLHKVYLNLKYLLFNYYLNKFYLNFFFLVLVCYIYVPYFLLWCIFIFNEFKLYADDIDPITMGVYKPAVFATGEVYKIAVFVEPPAYELLAAPYEYRTFY